MQATIQSGSVKRIDGVVYTRGLHGDLLADIYLPPTPGVRPAVVYIHGGAWKSGDRTQLRRVATALAVDGYVGVAIDYDLTNTGGSFSTALQQSERAVQWLRKNAGKYHVDPKRIAVAGSSAGGELAALVALNKAAPKDARVQAAIVFNGVLDLSYVGPDAEEMVVPYLGGSCADKPDLCRKASPIEQVRSGAPPFFVGHGTSDRIVPYTQAVSFVEKLRSAKVPVMPFVAEGTGHTYWNDSAWMQKNLSAVRGFLDQTLSTRDRKRSAAGQ